LCVGLLQKTTEDYSWDNQMVRPECSAGVYILVWLKRAFEGYKTFEA
jgi:hypothetical protein